MAQKKWLLHYFVVFATIIFQVEGYNTVKGHIHRQNLKGPFNESDMSMIYNGDHSENVKIILNVTETPITAKKWQVGRVSRKQYEIINMLWRKTNIFVDTENSSEAYRTTKSYANTRAQQKFTMIPKDFMQELLKVPIQQSSTPSYIEFYYLDESSKQKDPPAIKLEKLFQIAKDKRQSSNAFFFDLKSFSRSPFFSFHINDAAYKRSIDTFPSSTEITNKVGRESAHLYNGPLLHINGIIPVQLQTNNKDSISPDIDSSPLHNNKSMSTHESGTNNLKLSTLPQKEAFIDYETCGYTTQDSMDIVSSSKNNETDIGDSDTFSKIEPRGTTAYDKIKFFEIYDSATRSSLKVKTNKSPSKGDIDNLSEDNEINSEQKILLEHVERDIGKHDRPHTIKYAKKHVNNLDHDADSVSTFPERKGDRSATNYKPPMTTHMSLKQTSSSQSSTRNELLEQTNGTISNLNIYYNMTRLASWTKYPFVAVYVYERYQVHCDAAVVSPHWLLAAGSCLTRHSDNPRREGRSAFVTYCGEKWWQPELINYVKYTVVHPRYHPKDMARRHLYNIGAIQVVTSMANSCPKWAPVSIMSHQYATDQEGSIASAVGWGLDRYDTKYSTTDLPRKPLTVYEGLVFSDSCPGNSGYRKSKYLKEEGVKNIYCLSLPPYFGEDSDPVHGTILLVGGKLIALYLQEERRQWGDQSAQYTGVWRLVPWLNSVAHEPEEMEFLL